MKYIKHNYKEGIKNLYRIGIPISIGVGIMLFYLIYFHSGRPDRPIEYVGWAIVNIGIFWAIIGFPLLIILGMERTKKYWIVAYYRIGNDFVELVSPKFYCRKVKFKNIILIAYPKVIGSKLENLNRGSLGFICNWRYQGAAGGLNMKDSFRILVYYLKWLRKNPDEFKVIIEPSVAEPDDWKKEDTIKKALRKRDMEIWYKFVEEWWSNRNKEYWLKRPLEQILRDLHCPYSLDELENPSDDELVEIDEAKLIKEVC